MERVFLLLFSILLISAKCNKGSTPCTFGGYSFAVESKWGPELIKYNRGDTLYLASDFPKLLQDLVNPFITIDYNNSKAIGGGIGMGIIDTIANTIVPARDKFGFVEVVGTVRERSVAPDQGLAITYFETPNNYSFKCGIILKEKGLYMLSVSDLMSAGLAGKNCTNAGFKVTLSNQDQHLNIFEEALGMTADPIAQRTMYCFEVE